MRNSYASRHPRSHHRQCSFPRPSRKCKYFLPNRKHNFAFTGLLSCAYDDCSVTAEIKKQRYTYYHCTGFKGKCELPYIREEVLGERLGQILQDIYVPDDVVKQLVESLSESQARTHAALKRAAPEASGAPYRRP